MRLTVELARPLRGSIQVPGDKSICHRALMLGALAEGETLVHGFVPSADCLSTLRCLRALGVDISEPAPTEVVISGVGLHGLREPDNILDAGNSGTTMRLLAGILAGQPFYTVLTGDDSLRRRPMARIAEPLTQMGATVLGRDGNRLPPLTIRGGQLRPIGYRLPVASAQLKSAILLASLYAGGETWVAEPAPSRDHTERLLQAMGAPLEVRGDTVSILGGGALRPIALDVPGDFSSAGFFLVAGTIVPESDLLIRQVGLNPTRTGLLEVLQAMGASIEVLSEATTGGEPIGDLRVRGGSTLRGIEVGGSIIPRIIDELPVLAVAATQAEGRTVVRDAQELRVKETDRIGAIVQGLTLLGAQVQERPDGFVIEGATPLVGATCQSYGDHRTAMALAIAGLRAQGRTVIEGSECIDVSFPGFSDLLAELATGGD